MLYVLTGVRGAGKTTLIEAIRGSGLGIVLVPSTTRPPRFVGEDEYEFVTNWIDDNYAWSITVGDHLYGMRISEIAQAGSQTAFTVFDPLSIHVFWNFQHSSNIISEVIGIDTILDVSEQHIRVCKNPKRCMSEHEFWSALKAVRRSDLILTGSATDIFAKLVEHINR